MKHILFVPSRYAIIREDGRSAIQESDVMEIKDLPPNGIMDSTRHILVLAIMTLLRCGRKIEAIKLVREYKPGLGIKEAKELVDYFSSLSEEDQIAAGGGF